MKTNGTRRTLEVIPAASRLVRSLRDLGYDFPQAVADLVDNSIAADATRVSIQFHFENPDSWLQIVDNGTGMSGAQLTEAMRYGTAQTYGTEALGKFGLGLKTASLSQCRRLSVATRDRSVRGGLEARILDLNHVVASNRWEILLPELTTLDRRLREPLADSTGTVVLWESLDRVLGYKIPLGRRADSALKSLELALMSHLGMIFHRFLAGEIPSRPRLRIDVNQKPVQPWDPFARSEGATVTLPGCDIDVATAEGVGLVQFQPYVLPPRDGFSSEQSFHRASGPKKWNAQQGFYIYRANRMIQSGGWCRMRALDEHLKLARAAIDFYPELDSAFDINVAKVRVSLPAQLKERLNEPVESLAREAQRTYRSSPNEDEIARRTESANVTRRAFERAARQAGEAAALRRIVRQLKSSEAQLARRLGW